MATTLPHAGHEAPDERSGGGGLAAVIGPAGRLQGRPFTDPEETANDVLVMDRMLALEREVALTWGPDIDGPGISEQVHGEARQLLAVPNGRALLAARDVTAVGFFGRLREDVDHARLFDHERAIAHTFPAFAPLGFLSYFDFGPEHGRYGNLILFWTPVVPDAWHRSETHQAAVRVAPEHYEHIRLHRGRIPGPFMGTGQVEVTRTQYLDFAEARPWRALRTYATTER
jgi:hypothetical protein